MRPRFVGEIDTRWLSDGRRMKLLSSYEFIDSRGIQWFAPAGWIIDGASIPRFFWRACDPFIGRYRNASVVHDVYCDTKERPSHAVHAMFHEAMLAGGCPRWKAWLMWQAVRLFGPRFQGKARAA